MFDNQKIARQIRQARIQKDMTQMDLADRLGVSFQAVSNWERGNSLPDIGRLEELCQVLGLTLETLLGVEGNEASAVEKAVHAQPMTPGELTALAPMLPPSALRRQLEQREDTLDLSVLEDLAPFLEEAYLSQLVLSAQAVSLEGLENIAPFLSQEALMQLLQRAQKPEDLEVLLPFLHRGVLDPLLPQWMEQGAWEFVEAAAPFAGAAALDKAVAHHLAHGGQGKDLEMLYPFLSKDTLRHLAKTMLEEKNGSLSDLLPFL